jgi:predicted permease
MELLQRIAQVIFPVFFIVAIGYFYARRRAPDMVPFNRIALDVLAPVLVYSALAARDFRLADHTVLLIGAAACWPGDSPEPRVLSRARWYRW